jgi:serine protease Do
MAAELAAVGADIFAVGTPLDPHFTNTVTRGIVSAHREIDGVSLLQTDASVNPGNSGGPLFDSQGRVQAILSAKIFGPGVEGLAFGVPMTVVTSRLAITVN